MSPDHDEPNVFVDDDGLLRAGGRWVALTDAQLPVVRLLVSRLGSLVRNDELLAAYEAGGGTATNGALRPLVYRLRQRLAPVGLELHVVRNRGVLLEPFQPQGPA
jgi:DNA-binding winged helix-turn-helix (wHTH) protein